jgi:hypothetical protein
MRVARFVSDDHDAILVDWVAFARDWLPAAASLDEAALLDHGNLIRGRIARGRSPPPGKRRRQTFEVACLSMLYDRSSRDHMALEP